MSRPQCLGGLALCCCLLASLLVGCGRKDVAVVNGQGISRDELTQELETGLYSQRVLKGMIDRRLVERAFQQAGLKLPPDRVESELKQFREAQQLANDQAYGTWLASQGLTDAYLRRDIETGVKVQMLGEKDLKCTDADLQRYYQENRKRYDEPERVAFAEIVVAKEQEAKDVYAMTTKPGAKFPDLAKQYSIMPSRTEGGQRPLMAREDIIPIEARTQAFALPVGQVSQPFRSGAQWWLIKVTDRRPAKQLSFPEAKQKVERDYKLEHMVQPADIVQRLTSQARVEIKDLRYTQLQRLYMESSVLRNAPGAGGPGGAGAPSKGGGAPTPAPPAPAAPAGGPAPQGAQPPAGQGK